MNKQKAIWLINAFLILGYTFLAALFFDNYIMMEGNYQKAEKEYAVQVEKEMDNALAGTNIDSVIGQVKQVVEKYPMEVVVLENDKSLFKTLSIQDEKSFLGSIDKRVIAFESQGYYLIGDHDVLVGYTVYKLPNERYVQSFLTMQTLLVGLAFSFLFIVLLFVQFLLFKPLRKLSKSIEKIEANQFKEVEEGEDILNKKMQKYANKMQHIMENISLQHTNLERELLAEKEHLNNTLLISRSLIHDLKTPIHQTLLQNEFDSKKKCTDIGLQEALQRNIEQSDYLLKEVNEILRIMRNMGQIKNDEKEEFNLVEIMLETIKHVTRFANNKKLSVAMETEEEIWLNANKTSVKLLLNNIFDNAVQYATEESEIAISLEEDNSQIYIHCSNECSETNIERMKHSANLFTVMQQLEENEHIYSGRNGLFLINDLTQMLGGECTIKNQNGSVLVSIILPKGK